MFAATQNQGEAASNPKATALNITALRHFAV